MSGMNPALESLLGYNDHHVATEDSRSIYTNTWDCLDWIPGGCLNLISTKVVSKAPIFQNDRDACRFTKELFIRCMKH